MPSIRSEYRRLLKSGELKADVAQKAAIDAFSMLHRKIRQSQSWWRFLLGMRPRVYGLYLWGPPGRGKSMMMDLFFDNARVEKKTRVHFHAFMSQVHHLIRKWRESDAKTRKAIFGTHKGDDPIAPVAKLLAKQSQLLCFDELQVTDIADAVILGRLFEALFAHKVVLVATSNRPPDDLYKDGLNRDLFLPFIEMIKSRCQVLEVDGPKDFRLDRLRGAKTYFFPTTAPESLTGFNALWADMTKLTSEREAMLTVNERKLSFKRAAGPLLRATFTELCAAANGAADYLAIAERFTTVFIENVPLLSPANRNEARRFVTLIDALYEAQTKTVILAEAEPAQLYPTGDGAFEFERTVSRLEEMRSEEYLTRAHDASRHSLPHTPSPYHYNKADHEASNDDGTVTFRLVSTNLSDLATYSLGAPDDTAPFIFFGREDRDAHSFAIVLPEQKTYDIAGQTLTRDGVQAEIKGALNAFGRRHGNAPVTVHVDYVAPAQFARTYMGTEPA